jgi:type IV secretory pathway TrbL component
MGPQTQIAFSQFAIVQRQLQAHQQLLLISPASITKQAIDIITNSAKKIDTSPKERLHLPFIDFICLFVCLYLCFFILGCKPFVVITFIHLYCLEASIRLNNILGSKTRLGFDLLSITVVY